MIGLAIALNQPHTKVSRDFLEAFSQAGDCIRIEEAASAFGHKDQMYVQCGNYVATVSIFHVDDSKTKLYSRIMETIRGYVYSLKPTAEQSELLSQTVGVVRLVYNLALEQRRTWGGRPYAGGLSRNFGSKGLSSELSELRRTFDWIGAVSQTAQNQALIDLDRAYANFFARRAGYPKPRKRGRDDAFRQAGREISVRRLNKKWSEVRIPKVGWVRYRDTRALAPNAAGDIDIRNATIRRRPAGDWEISIALRCNIAKKPTPAAAVGIDRGVTVPYALSTGELIQLPETMHRRQSSIRRAQKALSRRSRGSKRYAKMRQRIARLKARDARTRAHLTHTLSRHLVENYGLVAIEDLKIRSMTASASGTPEEPGRNVAQKRGLNRSILNVGWHALERMLAYKMEETGGILVKVPAAYSSQTCSECDHVDKRSRKSQAIFLCTACRVLAHADVNAAKIALSRAFSSCCQEQRRGNTSLLDVEDTA